MGIIVVEINYYKASKNPIVQALFGEFLNQIYKRNKVKKFENMF